MTPHPSTPSKAMFLGGRLPESPEPVPLPGLPEPEGNTALLFPLDLASGLEPNEPEPQDPCGRCGGKGTVSKGTGSPWTNAEDCDHCDGTGFEQYIRCYVRDADGLCWQVMDGASWNEVCVAVKPLREHADVLVSLHPAEGQPHAESAHEAVVYTNNYRDRDEHRLFGPTEADALSEAVRFVEEHY